MKRGFAAQFGERFTRRLFDWLNFLSPQPRKRDLRLPSTSCYETGFVNSCFICSLTFIFAHRIIEH
jgi:hypothetical protein